MATRGEGGTLFFFFGQIWVTSTPTLSSFFFFLKTCVAPVDHVYVNHIVFYKDSLATGWPLVWQYKL